MLARRSAAIRVVRPHLLSRSVISWTPEAEEEPYDSKAKRGHPRTWAGYAQPVNPANRALLRLLQLSQPIEGQSAYQHTYAINSIACYSKPISTLEDVMQLRLGEAYKAHIGNYLLKMIHSETDPVAAYEQSLKDVARTKSLQETLTILPYFSAPLSKRLIAAGCESAKDLIPKNATVWETLTLRQQKVAGWSKHIWQPVTHEESAAVVTLLNNHLQASGWTAYATGAQRRGEPQVFELEILLCHRMYGDIPLPTDETNATKNTEIRTMLRNSLFNPLLDRGVIAEEFIYKPGIWEGMIRVPSGTEPIGPIKNRDGRFCFAQLRVISTKSVGATLLRTTGDAEYVKHLKSAAFDLGYHFDDYGLWQFHPNDPSQVVDPEKYRMPRRAPPNLAKILTDGYWELLASETEEQVLDQLNLPYIEPERRNFRNLKGHK